MGNFTPSYIILKCIYIKNPLSFNLFPANLLINSNLIFTAPILLTLSLSSLLLSVIWLTIFYSCPTVTIYNSISTILVSPLSLDPKVVAAVNSVVTGAFGSMLFNFFYYNLGSNYITEPCRKYYSKFLNGLDI